MANNRLSTLAGSRLIAMVPMVGIMPTLVMATGHTSGNLVVLRVKLKEKYMDKQEGAKLLAAAVANAEKSVKEAVDIADKYGLEFDICDQTYVGNNNGKRLTVEDYWDGTYYSDLDEDDPRFVAEDDWDDQVYAGWQNSSTFC